MEKLIKKANNVRNTSIASFVFVLATIVFAIISAVVAANAYVYEYTYIDGSKDYKLDSNSETAFVLLLATIICGIVGGICSFVSTIMILATDWKYPQLQSDKVLWGVLGIFLLGWISGWVFGVKAKNYIKSNGSVHDVTATPGTPYGPNADGAYL